jgi:hypothetical protein
MSKESIEKELYATYNLPIQKLDRNRRFLIEDGTSRYRQSATPVNCRAKLAPRQGSGPKISAGGHGVGDSELRAALLGYLSDHSRRKPLAHPAPQTSQKYIPLAIPAHFIRGAKHLRHL